MSTNNQNIFFNFHMVDKTPLFNPDSALEQNSDSKHISDIDSDYTDDGNGRSFEFEPVNKTTVFDVAAYVLNKIGTLTTMKLHKLVYYCQAWSLVWDEQPLFEERIEAWANGPVVRDLFSYHKGQYYIGGVDLGNPKVLSDMQKETIDSVLNFYGDKSAQWLIELTHMEDPWKNARIGLALTERGDQEISHESMAEYYSSL
mgnify:CR=1 FL=1